MKLIVSIGQWWCFFAQSPRQVYDADADANGIVTSNQMRVLGE